MTSEEPLPELPPVLKARGFALKERVAGGAFSSVYRATWTQRPNEDIAAKIMNLTETDQIWVMKNLKNELKIIRSLNHPNVVRVYELVKTKNFAYIFMEFARNGCVWDVLLRIKKGLKEVVAKKYMKDILTGLAFVHGRGIAHRDIKPENFLIDHNEKVMLSDFGFACISIGSAKLMKGTACGTNEYKAIEIHLKKEGEVYDAKASDLYSLGICLFVMIYFDHPFDPRNQNDMLRKMKRKEYKQKSQSSQYSNGVKELIDKLLEPNPKTRITSQQALNHIWFKS